MGFASQTRHSTSATSLLIFVRVDSGTFVRVCANGSSLRQRCLSIPIGKRCSNLGAPRLVSMASWNVQDSMKPHFSLKLLRVASIVSIVHDHKNCLECSERSRLAYSMSQGGHNVCQIPGLRACKVRKQQCNYSSFSTVI